MRLKKPYEDWETAQKLKVEKFCEHWNWSEVVSDWKRRLVAAQITIQPLFEIVKIYDPKNPKGRDSEMSWWPVDQIQKLRRELQAWFYRYPGTHGDIHGGFTHRTGELDTLNILRECEDELEQIAATFFAASIFSRIGSSRSNYPEKWPLRAGTKVLADWAHCSLDWQSGRDGWHHSCTDVLPYQSDDWHYRLETMEALVRYITEEHIILLKKYRPVIVEFTDKPDPFIEKVVQRERQIEQKSHQEFLEKIKQESEERANQLKVLRQAHPRYGEWNRLSNEELSRLVWTKPVPQLALEFGISDVAIGKRCKAENIPKPPPGFWRKVQTGKVPHPNGRMPKKL